MSKALIILILFLSLIVIFGVGSLIGKLLKLDEYLDEIYNKPHKIG